MVTHANWMQGGPVPPRSLQMLERLQSGPSRGDAGEWRCPRCADRFARCDELGEHLRAYHRYGRWGQLTLSLLPWRTHQRVGRA